MPEFVIIRKEEARVMKNPDASFHFLTCRIFVPGFSALTCVNRGIYAARSIQIPPKYLLNEEFSTVPIYLTHQSGTELRQIIDAVRLTSLVMLNRTEKIC